MRCLACKVFNENIGWVKESITPISIGTLRFRLGWADDDGISWIKSCFWRVLRNVPEVRTFYLTLKRICSDFYNNRYFPCLKRGVRWMPVTDWRSNETNSLFDYEETNAILEAWGFLVAQSIVYAGPSFIWVKMQRIQKVHSWSKSSFSAFRPWHIQHSVISFSVSWFSPIVKHDGVGKLSNFFQLH